MTLKIFAPPASGENDETQGDDWQTNYYTDAALYLGLVNKKEENGEPFYSISTNGKRILDLNLRQRQLEYCKIILSHKSLI